ncbi:MAG: hypothetical protein KAR06_13015 [Deltaproteobacteria bacterium]|nr:hypothetical protein [Deltaproteobacteria bacterium]
MELKAFTELSFLVAELCDSAKPMARENAELRKSLEEALVEIKDLKQQVSGYGKEKQAVKKKVDGLLQRIDGLIS